VALLESLSAGRTPPSRRFSSKPSIAQNCSILIIIIKYNTLKNKRGATHNRVILLLTFAACVSLMA